MTINDYVKVLLLHLLVFAGLSSLAFADGVVINEVYYDPVATESGGEAVALYNPTPEDIILGGYVLKTESAVQDVILPSTAVIKAKHYFLITDAGWSVSKDNSSWGNADYEETMNMFNVDSGVALLNQSGSIVDAVGWGNLSLITDGLYESNPSAGAASGFSLMRDNNKDTHNNFNDFVVSTPQLHNSSYSVVSNLPTSPNDPGNETGNTSNQNIDLSLNTTLNLVVTVENSVPVIDSVVFEDDNPLEVGAQIMPVSGANKSVAVHVTLHDANGVDDIAGVDLHVVNTTEKISLMKNTTLDSTKAVYSGFITVACYNAPGIYFVNITGYDLLSSATSQFQFTYLKLGAFSLDSMNLILKGSANTTITLAGDTDAATFNKPTVNNLGNVKLSLGLLSTDLLSSNNVLPAQQLGYSFGQTTEQGKLNTSLVVTDAYLNPNTLLPFNLFATLPETISLGDYAGIVTLYGFASE